MYDNNNYLFFFVILKKRKFGNGIISLVTERWGCAQEIGVIFEGGRSPEGPDCAGYQT